VLDQRFAKVKRYTNSKSATPLSRLLRVWSMPHRVSSRSVWADRLSSVGLSNCLLVGRMTISLKGMTETCKTPGNDSPECCPGKPCCNRREQAHGRQRHLHDGSPAIARGNSVAASSTPHSILAGCSTRLTYTAAPANRPQASTATN
jgi:hypothetical protein